MENYSQIGSDIFGTDSLIQNPSFNINLNFLGDPRAIVIIYAVSLFLLVLATIILEYHWRKYGKEIPAIKSVRPLYMVGAIFIFLFLTASFVALIPK